MDVLKAIQTKRAVRQFTEQPLPDKTLDKILKAALRAQSSKNTQPWQLIVIRERATLVALSELGDFMGHVAGAAACAAFAAPNDRPWIYFDLGQCAAYLQLAAHDLGVGSCIGAIYQPERAKELLGVPQGMSLYAVISLGYPSPEHRPAVMGGRKPVRDAVHWEAWGNRSDRMVSSVTDFAELEKLSTEELRERAFARARRSLDAGFFWDLFKHLPTAPETEQRELADLGAAIEDSVQLWREFTGHDYGAAEPLIRAKFIDYLTTE